MSSEARSRNLTMHLCITFAVLGGAAIVSAGSAHAASTNGWYTQEQAIQLFKEAGFGEIQLFSGFSHNPAIADDRLVCVVAIRG